MKCAGCQGEMKELDLQGVTIDRCAKCGGVWLDAGEAEELAAKSKASGKDAVKRKKYELLRGWKIAPQDPRETDRACPRCDVHLVRVNYKDVPGLLVDKCPADCGLYLDQGELEKVKLIG
jgi:Zn-finger nucleic acid-binding protein